MEWPLIAQEKREPTTVDHIQFVEFGNSRSRNFWRFDYVYINCNGEALARALHEGKTLSQFIREGRPACRIPPQVNQCVVYCGGITFMPDQQVPNNPWWTVANKDQLPLYRMLMSYMGRRKLEVASSLEEEICKDEQFFGKFQRKCANQGADPTAIYNEVLMAVANIQAHNVGLKNTKVDLESAIGQIEWMEQGGLLLQCDKWNFAQVEALVLGLTKAGFVTFGEESYTRIFRVEHPAVANAPCFVLGRLATMCDYGLVKDSNCEQE